jgi:hypothetical protein
MVPLLRHAGLLATLRLLTTGNLPDGALKGYGESILRTSPEPLATATMIARFGAAEVPASPYAYAVDPAGAALAGLIAGDPYPNGSPQTLLSDEDWVSLQAICN